MKVSTTHGLVDIEQLTIKDVVTLEESCRVTATEWYIGDELVRRDVNVNVLVGIDLASEQGAPNG